MRVRHQETDDEEEPVSTTKYGGLGPSDAQRLKSLEMLGCACWTMFWSAPRRSGVSDGTSRGHPRRDR
jgi:hypothetical protein